ncbi:MAG: hypothetical protein ACFUZC_05030 [Chthoniobacteraceae bacterium]
MGSSSSSNAGSNYYSNSTKGRETTLSDLQSMLGDYSSTISNSNPLLSSSQSALGSMVSGTSQQGELTSALTSQALDDVKLGSGLSTEQSRDATQSTREGLSSRGMSTGNNAIGQEILSRDSYGQQLKQQRTNNALSVSNMNNNIVQGANSAGQTLASTALGSATNAGTNAADYITNAQVSSENSNNNTWGALGGSVLSALGSIGGSWWGSKSK